MTDPKACVDVGHDYGSLVGCGFGIYKGIQVTGCSGTQYVGYAMQCINKGCLAMSSAKGVDACCTLTVKACGCYCITGAMAMGGGLAGGLVGYLYANREQLSTCTGKKDDHIAANMLSNRTGAKDQKTPVPVTEAEVIDTQPLFHNNNLSMAQDIIAPPLLLPPYEPMHDAPPSYHEAINNEYTL